MLTPSSISVPHRGHRIALPLRLLLLPSDIGRPPWVRAWFGSLPLAATHVGLVAGAARKVSPCFHGTLRYNTGSRSRLRGEGTCDARVSQRASRGVWPR